jgi:hypothetical protein
MRNYENTFVGNRIDINDNTFGVVLEVFVWGVLAWMGGSTFTEILFVDILK